MGDGVCVQMSWIVSCPIPSRVQSKARFTVLRGGDWSPRGKLSRAAGLSNWGRVTKRTTSSPQARHSGNSSDGEDSDSEGRSWWSPRDDFGLYPWDPYWDSPERDGKA